MPDKNSISTYRPTMSEAMDLIRSGRPSGLFATDGFRSYAFGDVLPDGRIATTVTSVGGRARREKYRVDQVEMFASIPGWWFESELDAYLKRERYVRLDADTSAGVALQLVHKCMRNPMEQFHDRISDTEMKAFNKACLNRVFTILAHLHDPEFLAHLTQVLYAPANWDPPSVARDLDPWAGSPANRRPDVSLKRPWRGMRTAPSEH